MNILNKAGIILVALLMFVSSLLAACSDNDKTPTAQPADNQTASQPAWLTDLNEPPKNPYLADSVWSTTHRNSYCQGSTPYAGPAEAPIGEIEDYLPGRPVCPTVLFSSPYPDGSQVIWGASTRFHIFKADPNGQQMSYIDWFPTAEMMEDPMTDEMVEQFGDMTSPEMADIIDQAFPPEESESGSQPGMSGVYYLLDRDGIFYQPRGTTIYAYGDEVKGDRFSPIELKRTYEIPADKLIRDDDFIYGVVMTYDGMLMFYTVFGTIGIIDRSFDPDTAQYMQLPEGEFIGNQPSCDENGGIYIVTQKQMHRVQWTGTELTTDESKGAWSAEYEGGVAKGRKFQEGSGASPSLMGVGDQDKFVVITDGAQIMNLVLFWRDEIPEDWEQIPGTKSRRIAAQVPVTYGNPDLDFTWSEQSVLVRGYGAFVPNDVLKIYHSNTAVNVLMSGEPDRAPYGCERFEWDPQTRQVKTVWASPDISIPNCIPTMSSATNLIYVTGQRDGMWTLEAIDWDTGEVAWNYKIGEKSRHNTAFAAVQVGPDGSIYFPTFFGIMRIRPTTGALPCETAAKDSTQPSGGAGGPGWTYNVTYGDENTVWTVSMTGEESIDGIDTYVIETTYDSTPERKSYSEQVSRYVDLELMSETVWQSKSDLEPVKMESMTKAMAAFDVTATSTYSYDGLHGAPLAEGNSWSYDQNVTPSMGNPYTIAWSAEVVGTGEVTVPAGTFECHKLVRSIEGGTITEWWATDDSVITPVKIIDEVTYEFPETRELASFTAGDGTGATAGPTSTQEPADQSGAEARGQYETAMAFQELMDLISETDLTFLEGARAVPDEVSVLEGYQWLTQSLAVAFDCYLTGDTARPSFVPLASPIRKYMGDNADSLYNFAPLDPNRSYRVAGNPGDAVYYSLTIYGGPDDGHWSNRVVSTLNDREMTFNPDGSFEVIISPDTHSGNWMMLESDAVCVVTRDYRTDPINDKVTTWEIEALDSVPPPRLNDAEMAQRLNQIINFLADGFQYFPMAMDESHYMIEQVNAISEPYPVPLATVGWAAHDAAYAMGAFKLESDEALIIEGTSPECAFWNMCLWNPYLQTYDYRYERVTINGGQVEYEDDGSWRIVISTTDPGIPNWVSTADHQNGLIWFRWFLAESVPEQPQTQLVKLSELAQ